MDLYLVFFRKPLRLESRKLQLRGYASRYSRLDVLARVYLSLREILGDKFQLYAFIPHEEVNNIIPIKLGENCPYRSERALTIDLVLSVIGGKARCFHKLKAPAERILKEIGGSHKIVLLSENGQDFSNYCNYSSKIAWAMGAHLDPPDEIIELLRKMGAERVSIGPLSYLSSHVAAYVAFARRICLDGGASK
jgi:tRNA pseudouridine-54 N-methylase